MVYFCVLLSSKRLIFETYHLLFPSAFLPQGQEIKSKILCKKLKHEKHLPDPLSTLAGPQKITPTTL